MGPDQDYRGGLVMLDIFEISPINEKDVKTICMGVCVEIHTMPDEEKQKWPLFGELWLMMLIMKAYVEYHGTKQKHTKMSSGGSCRRPGSIPGEGPDMLNRPSVRPSVHTMENGDGKK